MIRLRFPVLAGLAAGVALCLSNPEALAQSEDDDSSLLDELTAPVGGPEPTKEQTSPPDAEEEVEEITAAPPAAAVEEPKATEDPAAQDRIKAVPRKAVLKIGRFELAAFASLSLNDAYWQHMALSGSAIFYPHDSFGVGVGIDYLYAHARTSNLDVVRQTLISVAPQHEKPRLFGHVDFYWVPIYGKISLFNQQIVHFDLYGSAGVGMVTAFGSRQPVAVNAAIGQRFFLGRWLALRFEVRDHLFLDTLTINRVERSDVQSYVMFMAGAAFYVPPSFEYSYR